MGSFFVCTPITISYKIISNNSFVNPQVGFTVSKTKFKKAVDRNTIKRRMLSAYRLNKHNFISFLKKENKSIALMFIFNKDYIPKYSVFDKTIKNILNILEKTIKQ